MTTAANVGSIAIAIINRYETTLSGTTPTILQDLVSDNANYISQITGDTGLQDKYVPALIDLTIADSIAFENSLGVDADIRVGDVQISKGNAMSQQAAAIKFHLDKANMLLKNFIRYPMHWSRTYLV